MINFNFELTGMDVARYNDLCNDCDLMLTVDEIKSGWHFCIDFDCMLIHKTMSEYKYCGCRHKNDDKFVKRALDGSLEQKRPMMNKFDSVVVSHLKKLTQVQASFGRKEILTLINHIEKHIDYYHEN